jgi:hypothetical protein
MIAIQSKVKLQFPPACVGFVKMEIDLIQNKPSEEVYEIRIIDTCFEIINGEQEVLENGEFVKKQVEVEKILGTNTRLKKYAYAELIGIGKMLNIDFSDNSKTIENINELFSKGLLLITQSECQQGISGEGKGMYFSNVQDWETV